MWILPKNLQLSSGAPDTAGFISDLNEQSQICASSLMARSKASPARTWLQKWKRDSWTQHLSGRILRPSHARTFVTEWTSLWPVTPASHFPQPESDSAQKTLATSGHTSPDQYELFDLDYASLRMSKDTSPSDSEKSLESWNQSVTKRRGEYSARLKSAHRTSASGSSSWPTTNARDWKDSVNSVPPSVGQTRGHSLGMAVAEKNWPTTAARDYKGTSPNYLMRKDGKSRADQLAVAVDLEEQVNWPTPTVQEAGKIGNQANHGQLALSNHPAIRGEVNRDKYDKGKHGLPAPANPSTDGSRPESWATPECKNHVGYQVDRTGAMWPRLGSQVAGKLNPRWVETLMGLPVGWVMPSCASPVTIEPTSYASSATESCLPPQSELFAF